MAKNYLGVVYDSISHPPSDYPEKLCSYLFERFQLKSGMNMLEPGCGRGEFLSGFQKLGLHVTGADLSEETKNFAHSFYIEICDVERTGLPFADGSFDIVFSKSFVEHLHSPETYFEEAFRVLKPGGILLTLVPDWEANYKTYFDDFTHRTPFTVVSLEDAYKMYGFSNLDIFKFRQLPILWRFPFLTLFSVAIAPFVPVRTKNKFLRWSRELMLIGYGTK